MSTDAQWLAHTIVVADGSWYPLHQLARWSGAVAVAAPAAAVKQSMAEARASIDARCRSRTRTHADAAPMQLHDAYRKIGNVVCVSESGFTWSVKGWLALHADNAQLQQFAAQLHRTRQLVFHTHTQTATAVTGSAVGHAPVDTAALCAKFAFDSVEDDGATLASASLAAPDSSFSLAAFLDQHLQAPPATARGTASPLELQRNDVAAVATVRTELQQLQHHWQEQQQEAARINPPLVAAESARVNHYLEQVTALGHAHADVQARLRAHLEAAQPLHARVAALQSNMAFIQHVQLYEHLLRQATELSERCRETLGGHDAPHAAATGGADGDAVAVSASALDMHNVHSVCAMFLRLLRIYQGLRDTTRAHTSADGTAPKGDGDAHEASEKKGGDDAPPVARSWSGVLHLQRMVRTRILSILQPLKGRLIQLYQQTLAALHWPQTSNTLLLGMHTLPPVPTAASGNGAAPVPVSSPSAHSLDSSLQLFDLLTENLIRIQMLLSECGMHDEIRRIEREIDGSAARHAAAAAAAAASSASEKKGDSVSVPRLWVLSLLLQPIYKRFYYHFDSSAAVVSAPELSAADPASSGGVGGGASSAAVAAASLTNRLDKPEWVCTFLEKSFVDHRDFLQQRIQPIVNRCHFQPPAPRDEQAQAAGVVAAPVASTSKFQHYEFAMEFLEALLGFYHAKLIRPSTQAALLSNPLLLRHTLDELMSFEAKLEAMYGYPVQSSRRLSLLDAFLRQRSSFDALLKNERDSVNRALDALRNLDQPWQLVSRKGHAAKDDADSSDDEDADAGVQGLSAADSAQLEGGSGGGGGVDDALDGSSSLLHSAASATNSSHAFLSLISSLTRRYRSFKFLNLRLHVLKELQFKLFEIYEEDLIREFQDNWKRLATNARAGGLQYLMLERGGKGAGVGGGGRRSKAARLNPLRYWSTHCGLLNSIYYIATILREWNDEFIFLELYYFYTHKSKIQSSLLQAHHAHAVDPSAPVPVGGILVPSATAAGAATAAGTEEEEVLITSEELALWMTSGGSAVMPGSAAGAVVPAAAAATAAAAAERENQRAQVSSGASGVASYLPEGFQRTVKQLQALSSLETHSALSASSGFASASASVASPFMAPSLTPTSDSLFPKLTSSEGRGPGGGASRSTLPSSSIFSLPLELQMSGTLFEPILASYSSLREEMLHSLVGVVASHFRDALHQHGHVARGHMDAEHGAHGAAFRHPDLDHFFARAQAAPEGTAPALVADWMLLEHHVDISTTLCQPLLDLKMQLIVVHHSLTQPLHRSFWTAVAAKLNQLLFDELVSGQYFTRQGSLQFMRDMRAIFVLFAIYQQTQSEGSGGGSGGSGSALNPHFKLVQDTINLLLLSSAQLSALQVQLTQGGLASASAASVRQFLARPPLLLQKLNATQVLDLIAHIRHDDADQSPADSPVAEPHHDAEVDEEEEREQEEAALSDEDALAAQDPDEEEEEEEEQEEEEEEEEDGELAGDNSSDAAVDEHADEGAPAPEDLDGGFEERHDDDEQVQQHAHADGGDDGEEELEQPAATAELDASVEDDELRMYAEQAERDDDGKSRLDEVHSPVGEQLEAARTPTPKDDAENEIDLDDFGGFPSSEEEERDEDAPVNDAVPQ